MYVIRIQMCSQVRQFTQQLVLNSLTITAAGFFPINNFLTGKVRLFKCFTFKQCLNKI